MADAKVCDRCRNFYMPIKFNPRHVSDGEYKEGRPIFRITAETFGINDTYDLCPECGEAFRDFMGREITCMR